MIFAQAAISNGRELGEGSMPEEEETAEVPDELSVETEALFAAGNWHLEKGSFDEAVTAFRMAAKRAEALGDFTSQLECLQSAASALLSAGALKEAVEVTDEVLSYWEAAGSPLWPKALTLTTLAKLHLMLLEQASEEEEEQPFEDGKLHSEVAKEAADLAAALLEEFMNETDEVTAARASLDLASAVHLYGRVCLQKYEYETALFAAEQARRLYTEVQDTWGAASVAISQARAQLGMEQVKEAEETAQWALTNCELCENHEGVESAQSILNAIWVEGTDDWPEEAEQATSSARGLDYSRFEAIGSESEEEQAAEENEAEIEVPKPGDLVQELVKKDLERPPSPFKQADDATPSDPSAPSREVSLDTLGERSGANSQVMVRFLYASPLTSERVRPLDIRADLQALRGAKGVHTEVRVATVERFREVLFARPGPGILHISAHCLSLGRSQCLVFEEAGGAAYMMSAADLAACGPWDGVELLVFLSCSSEAFARELTRLCGLRRAVCCSVQLLDRAAHLFCATFYQALGGGRALLTAHEIARAAVRGSTDPLVSSMADKFVLLGELTPTINGSPGEMWRPVPVPVVPQPWPHWPLWPRVDDFVGRQSLQLSLAKLFEGRRAMCLFGARGLGKTAFCHEFCHHFSAPGGRRFSAGAFLLDYASAVRGANGDHPDAFASALFDELRERGQRSFMTEEPTPGTARQALRNAARQLDQLGPWLLVVDGLPRSSRVRSGSHSPSSSCFSSGPSSDEEAGVHRPGTPLDSLHDLLNELICTSARLCVLLTARCPLRGHWMALGMSKVVEVELPPLMPEDAARLFARRAARPFYRRDFGEESARGADAGEPLMLDQELIRLLVTSPLFGQLGGNPGRVLAAAAEVHSGLPSLLRHPWLLPAAV